MPHKPSRLRTALVLGGLGAGAGAIAHANSLTHNGPDQAHLHSMHSTQSEQFCVQSHTSDVSSSGLAAYIEQVLEHTPGKQWSGLAGGNIAFKRTNYNCEHYPSDTRATIELEYHVAYGWDPCGGSYYSCTAFDNAVWDAAGGHTDYQWSYVYFQAPHVIGLDARAKNFINHETGHVLGLTDPDDDEIGIDCRESVMRNALYDCDQYAYVNYPTSIDKAAVTRVSYRQN